MWQDFGVDQFDNLLMVAALDVFVLLYDGQHFFHRVSYECLWFGSAGLHA
jgi:hypothetical protein